MTGGDRRSLALLRDDAEAAAARGGLAALSVLPAPAARGAGAAAGWLAWGAGLRRSVAERQVAVAFPDRPRRWVRSTVRGAYRHFGRELAEVARLDPGRPGRIRDVVDRVEGVDRLGSACRRAVGDGSGGAVVVAGHLGNWEVGLAALGATGVPASVVVKPQRNRGVDRIVRRRRSALGVEVVEMGSAPREAPAALRDGRVVVLAADQDAVGRGVFVPFLGRPASTHRGPAALSVALDVPVVFVAVLRDGEGWRVVAERVDRSGIDRSAAPEREPVRALTRRWVALLEREVRRHPRQYLWFHRRWKTRPGPPPGADRAPGTTRGPAR